MDVEYTWTSGEGKNCRQFSLLSYIGQFVHPVGEKVCGKWGGRGVIVILARLKYSVRSK